ncbi:MAG: helix-turn-helix domain-containing GNAT family N-acetyltransferase [Saprospiraceae bacterium]|nr:helix-turn-helix domain-containing GNAT family N-acetyltransferase [Saprospiraceae bacterium]
MDTNFFRQIGKMALGSRLRRLSEHLTEEATQLYQLYQVPLHPKWFPVFYVLSQNGPLGITTIATQIGHSHPSVSKIVREMAKAGLIEERKDQSDGRRNLVSLSANGKAIQPLIEKQYLDVDHAVEDILAQATHNLWKALDEFEFLLQQKPLSRRVLEHKKSREAKAVQIIEYKPDLQASFKQLNLDWIQKYFTVEPEDLKSLDNPEAKILQPGGSILFAQYEGETIGTCALIPMEDPEYDFELAKMAVSPKAQGKGIGYLLGKAILAKAKELGAQQVYLESNTKLGPAINLYHKLGFQKVPGRDTPYERCNIQMAVTL